MPHSTGCHIARAPAQFFVTGAPTPHLNGKHVAFGEIIWVRACAFSTAVLARVLCVSDRNVLCAPSEFELQRSIGLVDVVIPRDKLFMGPDWWQHPRPVRSHTFDFLAGIIREPDAHAVADLNRTPWCASAQGSDVLKKMERVGSRVSLPPQPPSSNYKELHRLPSRITRDCTASLLEIKGIAPPPF